MHKQPATTCSGREQIAEALNGLVLPLRAGRSFRRYTLGWTNYRGKRVFYIGYSWTRTLANPVTGIVHDVILAYGDDFDSALAAAVAKFGKPAP